MVVSPVTATSGVTASSVTATPDLRNAAISRPGRSLHAPNIHTSIISKRGCKRTYVCKIMVTTMVLHGYFVAATLKDSGSRKGSREAYRYSSRNRLVQRYMM